ncbi:hypothetical protein [Streptomyces sp. NBC_00996]|uniref:hypothetical protein n=1 Tax=Streptomyces sp. NBC_00996 TaxID=2903710 RepID=UPI003865EA34|nr:hypothetical protein OG390_04005 [Streptomyces sp. NBC_00996]
MPLHVRVFDSCPLVMDRDENAARNLAALAAAGTTGTGVAGDRDAQASNDRGADRKTRATTRSRRATGERAGGTIPQQRRRRNIVIRTPKPSCFGDTVTNLPGGNTRIAKTH